MDNQIIDKARKLAMLREMLTWPSKQHISDILRRRIFALEFDVEYTNPFNEVDETLYRMGGRQ